jgi:DNA-binding MarR family transcriptional regulator
MSSQRWQPLPMQSARPSPISEETLLWMDLLIWVSDITSDIERALNTECGLSVADFQVLVTLRAHAGAMPQQSIGDDLQWSASRLSHQLNRMENRGLLSRSPAGRGRRVDVTLTRTGHDAIAHAEPIHAEAVEHSLLAALTPAHRVELRAALQRSGERRHLHRSA